jgi:hypothetical protein
MPNAKAQHFRATGQYIRVLLLWVYLIQIQGTVIQTVYVLFRPQKMEGKRIQADLEWIAAMGGYHADYQYGVQIRSWRRWRSVSLSKIDM